MRDKEEEVANVEEMHPEGFAFIVVIHFGSRNAANDLLSTCTCESEQQSKLTSVWPAELLRSH